MVRITVSLLVAAIAYSSNVSASPVNNVGSDKLVERQTGGGKLPFVPEPEVQCRALTEDCMGTVGFCQSSRNHGGFKTAEECIGAREPAPATTAAPQKKLPFVPEPEVQCRALTEDCMGTVGFCRSSRNHGGFKTAEECIAAREPAPATTAAPQTPQKKLPFVPEPELQCRRLSEDCMGTVGFCQSSPNHGGFKTAEECIAAREPAPAASAASEEKPPFVADPGPFTCRALTESCLGTVNFCDLRAHGGFASAKECVDSRQPAPAPASTPTPTPTPAPSSGSDGKLPFVADPGPVTCRARNETCLGTEKFCDLPEHGGFASTKECVDARQPAPKPSSGGDIVFPED
ncbi:hypothetical protein HIM_00679 [Hirsutella minnesotensis 3608]|nr:hypothetical protein HIM_00679 [Hirsutella minnesotensis 3608]